jgi:hypothetical protein
MSKLEALAMPKFLIEVSQESDALARKRITDSVHKMGSHFATRADWIRKAGVCTGTMVVETDDKWGALCVVPPSMRSHAHIFQLEPVPVT